ncbi:hypothetical protein [Pelosinus fermentans]|uniref:Uncharacterized protein n=1 Tax=Pelosinus fermentans JBW45 TaxID=1192197 RepID=I9NL41_9FIRM|nr:hypothetical protein [Pelosinus fermentans]AJQ28981.1 hypothetical protein JBW_03644 [Pelosinus fermentans JBW45]
MNIVFKSTPGRFLFGTILSIYRLIKLTIKEHPLVSSGVVFMPTKDTNILIVIETNGRQALIIY